MRGKTVIFGTVSIIALLFLISTSVAFAQSASTCGIKFISGNSVNYGDLQSGEISSEQTITLKNTGTVEATASVNGTNWIDSTSSVKINVNNTKYSMTSGLYTTKTALGTTLQNMGMLQPSINTDTFWQLQANLLSTSFLGDLTQALNFRVNCDGGSSQPTFSDDFSSYVSQSQAHAVWIPTDTNYAYVDTSSDNIKQIVAASGTGGNIYYDLGSNLANDWVLRFKIHINSITYAPSGSNPNNKEAWIGLTNSGSATPYTTGDHVFLYNQFIPWQSGGMLLSVKDTSGNSYAGGVGNTVTNGFTAGTDRWIEISKSGSTITLKRFTDSSFGGPPEATITTNKNPSGLRYLKTGFSQSFNDAGAWNVDVDDFKLWNGMSQVPIKSFQDDFSSTTGWTQHGTTVSVNNGHADASSTLYSSGDRIVKDIGFVLGEQFTVDFDSQFVSTQNANNGDEFFQLALSNVATPHPSSGNADFISTTTIASWGTTYYFGTSSKDDSNTRNAIYCGPTTTTMVQGTTYYYRMQRTDATNVNLKVYINPERTSLLTSCSLPIPATIDGLRYIHIGAAFDTGSFGTRSFWTDNIKITDNS